MNIAEFTALAAEKLEVYLREQMQENVTVQTEEIIKINDQHLHGVSILKGEDPAPTYYLNGMFQLFENGVDPEVMIRDLADTYVAGRQWAPTPAEDLPDMSFRSIRRRAGLRLVGMEYNEEYLKTVPFQDVGNGYALLCEVQVKASDGGLFSTVVTNEMVRQYSYDMDRLFKTALENAWRSNAASLRSASELISEVRDEESKDACYVLTTDRNRFGAAALFYPGTQAMIAHVLGEDYIAIPSSLHEFIIVRESCVPDPEHIKQMVWEANRTIVAPEEVLSDNLLKYSKSTRALSLLS